MAGEENAQGGSQGLPCPHCGRPQDDYATMTEEEALASIQTGLLRDLARKVNAGDATGQELQVARALLRDNAKKVKPDHPEDDPNMPPMNRTPLPQRRLPDYGPLEGE